MADLGITTGGGRVDPKCSNRGFSDSSSFSEGVICFNGITVGSTAVYICDNGFILVGNEARVCQSNGSWNGRTPQCVLQESGTYTIQLHPLLGSSLLDSCSMLDICWLTLFSIN